MTHHHDDHIGGVPELKARHAVPDCGPRGEPIATLTHPVSGGDRVGIGQLGVTFEVIDIPGHTRAHVGHYGANMLFCGEAPGCGREGANPLMRCDRREVIESAAQHAGAHGRRDRGIGSDTPMEYDER